jgi:hypothetical protein
MNFRIRILAALVAGGLASVAHAEGFVVSQPGSGLQHLDLGSVGAAIVGTTGVSSVDAGPFVVTNTGAGAVIGETAAAVLGGNGTWQAISPWADTLAGPAAGAFVSGLTFDDNAVTFTLDPGLSTAFVGVRFMVDTSAPPAGTLILSVFDTAGALISTSPLQSPVSTGGINESAFIGYVSDTGAIGSFSVQGGYHVYGDITYAQPVPEPAEWAFMMAGLSAAAAFARRRRASKAA